VLPQEHEKYNDHLSVNIITSLNILINKKAAALNVLEQRLFIYK